MSNTLNIVSELDEIFAQSQETAANEKRARRRARRRDSIVLKKALEASKLEQTQYQTDQANTNVSYASTEEEEQALFEEVRVLTRIEEQMRMTRAHQQQEFNNAEKRLLQNSIISANKEETSRLRRKRLENLHLEKAIAESNLYRFGPRRRAHVDYHEVNPPPASRVVSVAVYHLPIMNRLSVRCL